VGKASGFIAGADVEEFKAIENEAAALAIVRRPAWDTSSGLPVSAIRQWR
jgi:hypothetical protein